MSNDTKITLNVYAPGVKMGFCRCCQVGKIFHYEEFPRESVDCRACGTEYVINAEDDTTEIA
jgi:uncharacterized protein (DUF983 family)